MRGGDVWGRRRPKQLGGGMKGMAGRLAVAALVLVICTLALFSTIGVIRPSDHVEYVDVSKLWGTAESDGWRPSSAPRAYWPPPPSESNGYLRVRCNGGLNQQRTADWNVLPTSWWWTFLFAATAGSRRRMFTLMPESGSIIIECCSESEEAKCKNVYARGGKTVDYSIKAVPAFHSGECVQADPSRLSAAVKQKWKMDAEVCVTDEDSDDDAVPAHKTAAFHSGGVGPSRPSVINHFIAMGFDDKMTEKVVRSKGEENTESILDTLLESSQHVETPVQNFSTSFHDSINLGGAEEVPEQLKLIELGYSADEASAAINRCGQKASFFELIDSITAARLAAEDDTNIAVSPMPSDCESYDSNDSITAGRLAAEDDTNIAVSPMSSDCESYDSNDHISKKRRRS